MDRHPTPSGSDAARLLSEVLYNHGLLLALLPFLFRGVVGAVLDKLRTSTTSGMKAALSQYSRHPSLAKARNAVSREEQKQRDEAEEAGIKALTYLPASARRVPGVTLNDFDTADDQRNVSWEQTLAKSQRGACRGVFEAVARLLLWHALQPVVHLAALYVYWADLGWWQRLLGAAGASARGL